MTLRTVTAVVVGAGHSGLAMSRALRQRGIDHLVLDKGRVGEAWRSTRWDSLRLQTPNWANGLPGAPYGGFDQDGFMAVADFAARLQAYAQLIDAPVETEVEVASVTPAGTGYILSTTQGPIQCRALVVAAGACARPRIPALTNDVPAGIVQTTPAAYKRPSDLPDGPVLVVGASASGVQLAREIQRSGRPVTLAVGSHIRLPRRYRDRDIEWWLEATGLLDEGLEAVDDIDRVRRAPSPQLTGDAAPVDLAALQATGVELVGRLMAIREDRALFSGGLAHLCTAADLKLARLTARIEDWIAQTQPAAGPAPAPPPPTPVPRAPRLSLDLASGQVAAILWATGYAPDLGWLTLPVFDRRGGLRHDGGVVTDAPGLYALGLPFLRRRRSAQISGAGGDASALADHLHRHLHTRDAA